MAKVTVSREARADVRAIREYIRVELQNPDAAKKIVRLLREHVQSLEEMPERGVLLDTVLPVHTNFRFLVCQQYSIFYVTDGASVEVVRILHRLQDYMRALFS